MKIARLVGPTLIACALVASGGAYAAPQETPAEIIKEWAQGIANVADTEKGTGRETTMGAVMKHAKGRLAKASCKDEGEAKNVQQLVNAAVSSRKLPLKATFTGGCDAKAHTLTGVDFTMKIIPDTAQDTKDDATNVAKIASAIATWGTTMRTSVDATHEQDALKGKIDAATTAAAKSLSDIACRRTADASISDMVAAEVGKQKLQIDYTANGNCDAQTHKWRVELKVTKFATAFDPKKDQAGVGFSQGLAADLDFDEFLTKAKAMVNPPAIGWDKRVRQSQDIHQLAAVYVDRLNKIKCGIGPTDKLAGYVQDMITKKASAAHDYLAVNSVRVMCNGGHLNVSMNAEPAAAKVQPTIGPKAQAK